MSLREAMYNFLKLADGSSLSPQGDLNPNYMDIWTLAYAVGITTRFEFERNFFNLVTYLSREKNMRSP